MHPINEAPPLGVGLDRREAEQGGGSSPELAFALFSGKLFGYEERLSLVDVI